MRINANPIRINANPVKINAIPLSINAILMRINANPVKIKNAQLCINMVYGEPSVVGEGVCKSIGSKKAETIDIYFFPSPNYN